LFGRGYKNLRRMPISLYKNFAISRKKDALGGDSRGAIPAKKGIEQIVKRKGLIKG